MKIHAIAVLWLLLVSTLSAQTVPPALMVKKDGVSSPLGLAKLRTEVRIYGSLAETTTTMTFTNPTARAMEGDLYFPLPEGATISGYALDIGGAMVDGVAVEKHEARRIFESIVRRGIDPGLVQWTKGNNFQTRVFPIPANGSRTVRVQYVTELIGGKDAPAYYLPLKFKEKVPEFSLRIEVIKPAAPPVVAKGELANFSFEKWRDSYVAETQQRNWKPSEDMVIALPKADGPQVLVEKADDGQVYFAIEEYPSKPASEVASAVVHRAVVFWDASGSRAGDHKREIALLQGCLDKLLSNQPADDATLHQPKISVDLVLLRNAASKPTRFDVSKANLSDLAAALEKVQYDGGTQLGAIGPLTGAENPDVYLLFSDGISNFGREEPNRLDSPLYVFSAAGDANHPFLHCLAMSNGGRYFNLVNWKDADVIAQVGRPAWSFLSASIEGGDVKELYPQLPKPLAGRFTLVGKFNGESATVTVNYGNNVPGESPEKRTFKVLRSDAAEGSLLRRLWAQKKLAELMIYQKRNEKQIAALGKQFGLVTPYTSLLVLDSLEQYVQYEIVPPKSLPAMREEYLRQIDTLEHQKQKQKADKLAAVIPMWEERVKWWNAKFKFSKDFKYKEEQEDHGMGGVSGMGGMGGAPPAASAPAPRTPSAERAADTAKSAEEKSPSDKDKSDSPASPQSSAAEPMHPQSLRLSSDTFSDLEDGRALPSKKRQQAGRPQPGIVIKPWDPDTPYLQELRAAKGKGDLDAVYMKNRAKYGTSPAFFLDCSDFFREAGNAELALQVLSNIAELELEDAALLRVLGHRLVQIGQLDLAVQTFQTVLDLRPEEPQSYRDLALTLAQRAEQSIVDRGRAQSSDAIQKDYARAVDLLVRVVMGHWDERFPEIEVIALEEVNRIIPRAKAAGVTDIPLDPRLLKLLDVDVRIVMTWHADDTDIDLWVTEPSGEKAFYGHNRTTIGGLVSCDFTGGYGPEEYMVRRAVAGKYKIEANYFGSRSARLLGPVTVQVDVFTNYGRANEQRKSLTLRLKDAQETFRIGEIEF
jgi:Ca-activated chloride channel homolog